jgi:hypothetical protein
MDVRCPKCGGQSVTLLQRRPDGSTQHVCITCGTNTVLPDLKSRQDDSASAEKDAPRA